MTEQHSLDQNPQSDDQESTEGISIRRRKLFSSRDMRASAIGWEIAIPIVAGPFFGFVLDRRLDSGVQWTMILLGVGLISAVASVLKYLNYELYLMNKELKEAEDKGIKRVWRDYDDEE
ncbi:MAG: AtpZ/AtpI family protein [Anaerolineaceae bacterium]|jgi:F0F1-type ATP synthase assembly protein I|nr:AtpZ/AtpI family protein [Anaerolineaceae bacterium]